MNQFSIALGTGKSADRPGNDKGVMGGGGVSGVRQVWPFLVTAKRAPASPHSQQVPNGQASSSS